MSPRSSEYTKTVPIWIPYWMWLIVCLAASAYRNRHNRQTVGHSAIVAGRVRESSCYNETRIFEAECDPCAAGEGGFGSVSKREVNAKDFMRDVQEGMDDVGLMKKYRLTPKGLDSTFRKLLTVGLISKLELAARTTGQTDTVDLAGIPTERVDPEGLHRLQKRKTQYLYSGTVEGVDILDYIQWMLMEGRQTVLEVRPEDGMPCTLYISNGKILHAKTMEMLGEDAFYSLVQSPQGKFSHLAWNEPETISIDKAGMQLLFEAARLRDEADSLTG
jgi:hypothetical protein